MAGDLPKTFARVSTVRTGRTQPNTKGAASSLELRVGPAFKNSFLLPPSSSRFGITSSSFHHSSSILRLYAYASITPSLCTFLLYHYLLDAGPLAAPLVGGTRE